MLETREAQNVEITGVKFMNSPQFHLHLIDISDFYLHDFEIHVDIVGQFTLCQFLG